MTALGMGKPPTCPALAVDFPCVTLERLDDGPHLLLAPGADRCGAEPVR